MHIDASAALAITQRQGLVKLRHIVVHWLWVQDQVNTGAITTKEVDGNKNFVDLLATHLAADDILKYIDILDFEAAEGRARKFLSVHAVGSDEVDHWTKDEQCIAMVHQ